MLSLALFPLFAGIQKAHAAEGLTAEVYNVRGQNNAPYIPQGLSPVLTRTVPNIDFQWGSGSVLQGPSEDVIVRFTGSILSNTTQDISFYASADDGTKLYLDGVLITNDWFDKGGGGTTSAPIPFTAGVPKTIELMYYENGGGASVFLYWDQSGSMQIIPAEAFTSVAAPIVKTIGAPRNLTVTDGATSTTLTWDAPNTGNTQPERYAISFNVPGNGWGIATGNVGDANALNTSIIIDHSLLEQLKPSGTTWTFSIRSDNDTEHLYSDISNQVTLKIGLTQEEKDAQAAVALAAQQELDRQTSANTAVTNYENQQIRTLSEVSIAEDLKLLADTATAIVLNQNIKATLQSRIDAKTSTVSSTKILLTQAKLEAEAAARLAAEQEAARIAAQQEAARQAAIAAEAARIEAARQAAIAEANRIAAEQEAARQAAIIAEQYRLAEIARQAAIKAEQDRIAAELAAQKAEADRLAAEERARIQAEIDAKAEADRIAAEKAIADAKAAEEKAAAEAKAAEETRIAAEKAAKEAEAARLKAEEEARIQAEKDAKAKVDAEKAEADRLKAELEAKAKAEEDARLEAIKKANEEAKAKAEAEKKVQEEVKAKAEADRLAQIAKDKAAEEARIAAEQKAKEAEAAKLKAEADRKLAEEKALNDGKITVEDTKKVLDNINADGKVTQAEVKNIVEAIKQSEAPLTSEQKDLIATVVISAAVSSGENVTAAQIQEAGIEYKDLPTETPVEIRTSENGEVLVITAETAAQTELVQDPGALAAELFNDPGAAIAALGSIGADMTPGEREEATKMVVATVVATGAALNAVGLATGGGAPSAPSSGSSSGTNSGGTRRNERW